MAFTGKATYSAGAGLPELMDDVSDIVGIVSPFETPLLDHLGDAQRPATSVIHEWMEDALLPSFGIIADNSINDPDNDSTISVGDGTRFRMGDQIKIENGTEIMIVLGVFSNTLNVGRRYGGTPTTPLVNGAKLNIIGNAAIEGEEAPNPRFTNRTRKRNFTQIFTASVEVSGSQLASDAHGIADEVDYQKQNRLRELLRDLEQCVINGAAHSDEPQGNETTPRTMRGLIPSIESHHFIPGIGSIPEGDGDNGAGLTEPILNAALREIWERSSGHVDTIVCGGAQKRRINGFMAPSRRFDAMDRRYRSMVDVYESDFGVCKVIMSRWLNPDTILLLDSSRIDLIPLTGRSFGYKPLATVGDSVRGQLIGEYTLEMRNEQAHGMITDLDVATSK